MAGPDAGSVASCLADAPVSLAQPRLMRRCCILWVARALPLPCLRSLVQTKDKVNFPATSPY